MKSTIIHTFSYMAFLLLIMPPTLLGIIQTMVLSAAGLVVIIWNKPKTDKKVISVKNLLIVAGIEVYLTFMFYNRWLPSSKVSVIAGMIHLTSEILLVVVAMILTICAAIIMLYGIDRLFRIIENLNEGHTFIKNLICGALSAIITVVSAQIMINVDVVLMGLFNFFWNVLIIFVLIMMLYCITNKIKVSVLAGTSIFMFLSTVNVYIYNFRGRLFEPVDIFSVGTAMNVADNYNLWPIPVTIISGWAIWAGVMIFILALCSKGKSKISAKLRIKLSLCCVGALVAIGCYSYNLKTYHWHHDGALFNGYVLDFVSKIKEVRVSEPKGYSEKRVDEIAEKYTEKLEAGDNPHIIVIMDEAFSDLSVLGDIKLDKEVMPFISSMKENVISGYALASVYGGNTANSEYEFLTGNTMAWLSPNVVPYQQYIRSEAYSLVSYLKANYDYNCIAMHPYLSDGWNRPITYQNFGFEESLFLEDFPQKNIIRNYVSDQEMFEKIVEIYENEKDEPLFLFGVSMQNHGGYNYVGENFEQSVSLSGYENEYPTVNQYLSLIHETDKAVEYLISYFSKVDEEVVIVFFGDHQPRLEEGFYNEIGATDETLDAQQNKFKVPFFIWTNYDSEEKQIDCTSLNYLTSYVYESANIELPPYNQFLSDMENVIPAINANGFYSLESKRFLPMDEASEKEKEWLQMYEILQYNNLFGDEQRNDNLFITLE